MHVCNTVTGDPSKMCSANCATHHQCLCNFSQNDTLTVLTGLTASRCEIVEEQQFQLCIRCLANVSVCRYPLFLIINSHH